MIHHLITVNHGVSEVGLPPTWLHCTCGWKANCGYGPTLSKLNRDANDHLNGMHIDIDTGEARQ